MLKIKKYNSKTIQLISTLYVLTISILLLDGVDNFPLGNVLRKIKYIYLIFMIVYFILSFHNNLLSNKVVFLISCLCLHTGLFGFILVNNNVLVLTHIHAREMFIYIALVFFTYYFVSNENLFNDFMCWNYWGIAIPIVWSGITHPSNFVNPLYFIYVFSSNHSYRTDFGFGHANFTGNLCLFALVYSVFLLETLFGKYTIKGLITSRNTTYIIFTDVIIGEMLFSTQSRTSILAFFVFIAFYLFFNWNKLTNFSNNSRFALVFFVLAVIGIFLFNKGFDEIWSNSHRDSNITINYPIFKQFNEMIGMGYIPASGFYTNAYGLNTFPLDIYYVYIFFTTGYIGSAIILLFLFYSFYFILEISDKTKRILSMSLFFSVLFAGIGQTNMISYTNITSMINWSIILCCISSNLIGE